MPITDNCKYYYIYGMPINTAYMIDRNPFYDVNNKYILQAKNEYELIINKFGEDGLHSFIEDLCNLKVVGTVDAEQMLNYIHFYSDKKTRKAAIKRYEEWKDS